jgi:hypothetical protein
MSRVNEPSSKEKRRLDIAYGCYVYLAVFACLVWAELCFDYLTYENEVMLSMWLVLPAAFILAAAAVVTALALTIRLWRQWPLIALLAVLALLSLLAFGPLRDAPCLFFWLCLGWLTAVLLFAGRWFFRIRPRSIR